MRSKDITNTTVDTAPANANEQVNTSPVYLLTQRHPHMSVRALTAAVELSTTFLQNCRARVGETALFEQPTGDRTDDRDRRIFFCHYCDAEARETAFGTVGGYCADVTVIAMIIRQVLPAPECKRLLSAILAPLQKRKHVGAISPPRVIGQVVSHGRAGVWPLRNKRRYPCANSTLSTSATRNTTSRWG